MLSVSPKVIGFLVIFLFGQDLIKPSQGFKQELWLYLNGNDSIYFDQNVPDLASFAQLLPTVESYCARGVWSVFEKVNYVNKFLGMGTEWSEDLSCGKLNGTYLKSLRHFAASKTETDALSLFSERDWVGSEILVTGQAIEEIYTPVHSVGGSGNADWTLFEGPFLDGISSCFRVPRDGGYFFNWASEINLLNLTIIQSAFKGCDKVAIELYKEKQQQQQLKS